MNRFCIFVTSLNRDFINRFFFDSFEYVVLSNFEIHHVFLVIFSMITHYALVFVSAVVIVIAVIICNYLEPKSYECRDLTLLLALE